MKEPRQCAVDHAHAIDVNIDELERLIPHVGRIRRAVAFPDGGRAFRRPLTFGDAEQVRILSAMNGDYPYCDKCFHVLDRGTLNDCGLPCEDGCRGIYVPSAPMTNRYAKFVDRMKEAS